MIAAWRSTIERNTPRLSRRRVSLENKVSTALSQEHDAFLHEPLLPAPHHRLAAAGAALDGVGAQPVCGQQNDAGPPDMLLRAVSVRHHRLKQSTVGGCHIDDDPFAHAPDSHDACEPGILSGTRSSDCMH